MDHTVKLTVNGETREFPMGITYKEVVKAYEKTSPAPVILVIAGGKICELHKKAERDGEVQLVTTKDSIGNKTYKRTACLVLLKAIYDLAGKEKVDKVVLHYSVGSGFYFTMEGEQKLDQAFLDQVKKRMTELVEQKIPVKKRSVGTDEAIALFHHHRMYDKEKLFRYRRVSRVNIYSIENFEDYFYGAMAYDTGYVPYFDLKLYDEGFVLILPDAKAPAMLPEFRPQEKIFQVQKDSEEWGRRLEISTVGELNDQIVSQGIQKILLMQEAIQESGIARIAEQIVEAGNKKFVMIAGPSSSGKTTFSHRLSIQLAAHGMKPHPIAVDNYFVNREHTPLDEFGEKDYECLEAIDVEKFNQDMSDLLAGKRVEMPRFNFKTGLREYKGDYLQLGPEDILVIEGIHGLNDRLSHSLPLKSKYKIYISALTSLNVDDHNRIATTDSRLIRRMVRDARTRGASATHTLRMWSSVRRGEEENIFPFQESADAMFNSALIYELAVLKQFAEPLLYSVRKDQPEYFEAKRLLKFLEYFLGVSSENLPNNSIVREFVGGSCFRV